MNLHNLLHAAEKKREKCQPMFQALCDLPEGATAVVQQLHGGREFTARVIGLGFLPGAEVRILQNYGSGPIIVTVCGGRVALGRGEASKIQVECR
jgi:ferrous iron transport protein A